MRKLFLLLLFLLCIGRLNAQNQQKTITGTVLDTDGVEMIGVSIQVEGTVLGVITNLEGLGPGAQYTTPLEMYGWIIRYKGW